MLLKTLFYIFTFAISASVASYLKLIVDRYDSDDSVIFKPSYCPSCKEKLLWWQNIPILSFFLLKGKCSFCGVKIKSEYFITELLIALVVSGLVSVAIRDKLAFPQMLLFVYFVFALILLVLFDLKHKIIPHFISYTSILVLMVAVSLLDKSFILPVINLGVLFLCVDYFIGFVAWILKKESDFNLISVPLVLWLMIFFFYQNIILVSIPIILYFLVVKFLSFGKKTNTILWFLSFVLIMTLFVKALFVDFDISLIKDLFVGVGLIYLFCEILFYLIGIQFLNLRVPNQDSKAETAVVLGGGDVTVLAIISVFLGFKIAFLSLFLASILGLFVFLLQFIYKRLINTKNIKLESEYAHYVPFVPYIVLACFIIIMIY
ncbi:MAG: prepilin peptidase [Candidatus Melainabacteria bacterium]|nr:prepilin peptidase [Candidatus Melainabacteria bacterium]